MTRLVMNLKIPAKALPRTVHENGIDAHCEMVVTITEGEECET